MQTVNKIIDAATEAYHAVMPDGVPTESSDAFPTITLDTTLAELLQQEPEATKNGAVIETLCHIKPNSEPEHQSIPQNDKFLITSTPISDSAALAHMQLENVTNLLSFWAGPMKIVYIGSEGLTDDELMNRSSVARTANRNFSVLEKRQRPDIQTYANADDMIKNHDGSPIRWGFATDFAEHLPALFSPELVYKLNSKRWLAECDLKSANDTIIDPQCECSDHKTNDGLWYYGGKDCKGCQSAVQNEIERVRKILEEREVPFVLKLTNSLGSVGTEIAQDEDEKKKIIEYITTDNLPSYLPRITTQNAHIHPTALILSDFVKGDTMALNFFIRKDGSPIFLGACHQLSTRSEGGGRQCTALTYADQPKLKDKYIKKLEEIGKVLNREGYYGTIGADIMEDPNDKSQVVIDLNVRTPTSYNLYLLKSHCEQRGFGVSIAFECIILTISREELGREFAKEAQEGRLIVLGSTRLGSKNNMWAYPTVLAGETQEEINKLSERILKYEVGGKSEMEEAGA